LGYFDLLETPKMRFENKFGEFLIPIPNEKKINQKLIDFAKKFCERQGKKPLYFLKFIQK